MAYMYWYFVKVQNKDAICKNFSAKPVKSFFCTCDVYSAYRGIHDIYTWIAILSQYSGPSLSGHTQQRPPSLMWPQIFGTATMNAFTSPFHQRPPL